MSTLRSFCSYLAKLQDIILQVSRWCLRPPSYQPGTTDNNNGSHSLTHTGQLWDIPSLGYLRHSAACCMMTSSNGNIFRVTGPLCWEFTGHRWIPSTKVSDAERWCFLWSAPWINGWVNNCKAGDLTRHRAYYYVTVIWTDMKSFDISPNNSQKRPIASIPTLSFMRYRSAGPAWKVPGPTNRFVNRAVANVFENPHS